MQYTNPEAIADLLPTASYEKTKHYVRSLHNAAAGWVRFLAIVCILGASPLATALPDDSTRAAYVDSVYEWGAWEMGIVSITANAKRTSNQALNIRLSNIKFRPNDISVVSPIVTPVRPPKDYIDTGDRDK
jgi:hypothetical protein